MFSFLVSLPDAFDQNSLFGKDICNENERWQCAVYIKREYNHTPIQVYDNAHLSKKKK